MSSPLTQAGAISEPSKSAPLHTNRFFTGLWTQRNPLRDAATPFIYEKFYSASRFDSLIDGLNTEVTTRLTLARRAGHSVYNSQTFPTVNRFHEFRTFSTASEQIRVMADCVGNVYDATGPSTKNNIFTKSAGAGPTFFQGVGNTLYMGNGVDQKKWAQSAKAWLAATLFNSGDFLVDTNNNIQVALGARTINIVNVTIASNMGTITTQTKAQLLMYVGMSILLSGLTTATFLNGQTVVITSLSYNQFTFAFTHANYGLANDAGTASTAGGNTGGSAPTWSTTFNGITADGSQQWICKGSSVQQWGQTPSATAPLVSNSPRPSPYPLWTANTVYSSSLTIVDGNTNIQQLTTGGTTGGAEPTWNATPGGTTTDGSAVWTNMGTANWQANHAYAAGALIFVTFTYWVTVPDPAQPSGGGGRYNTYAMIPPLLYLASFSKHPWEMLFTLLIAFGVFGTLAGSSYSVTVSEMFKCTTAGTSGSSQPAWVDGNGSAVVDNTAVWTNIGAKQTWAANVGATTLVSLAQIVIDSNGNQQQIQNSGKSGAVAPTWATGSGQSTVDNLATWLNGGPFSAANTKPWLYAYAYKNSVVKNVSTASPSSIPIILAASDLITVQGATSTNVQDDIIQIYRTALGGSTLLLLDEIPAPAVGSPWIYYDSSSDANLALNVQAQIALSNNPPPAGLINLNFHMNRVWGSVGNTLYYAAGPDTLNGQGQECFPPLNSFIYPSLVVRTWSTSIGLLVFTTSDIYIVLGQGTSTSGFYSVKFLEKIGLLNYDAFSVNGSTAYLMTTSSKQIALDPGAGVTEIGFPIGDVLLSLYAPASTYVTWHEGSSGDTALYVADGSAGWFRMSPVAAPETGFAWSPRGVIAAGCKAVQSVQVLPGTRKLLVGPVTSGPILQRDPTVNKDNTAAFGAFFTIGSITLAQPGQLAEIQFITADSIRVGTAPVFGVILDEISGTFQSVVRSCPDPPLLPASTSLFNDRYYMAQNQEPTFCRHFQLKLTWASEDAHNELLSYTIFGSINLEK